MNTTPERHAAAPEPIELWERATVLKFFGGNKPLHQSTLYRGMKNDLYPRPIFVAGNAVRWVRSECEAARQRMLDKRAEPKPTAPPRGRPRGRPRRLIATETETA